MRALRALVGATLVACLVAGPSARVEAAGVTTHAWMALEAVDLVSDPALRALLDANRGQVEGGAQFPDSGYFNRTLGVPGGDYGEEAHWQRFFDSYADRIAARTDCGDLTDPTGPCAASIAHLMGMVAHGMGDQVWDWLFEPYAAQYGEEFLPPELSAFVGPGGIEFQMDIVAIGRHGRLTSPDTPPLPSTADLAAAFGAVGRTDITESGLTAGKGNMKLIRDAEGAVAPTYLDQVEAAMPWTSANMVTAPGGVRWAAVAIAAQYENVWGRIRGAQPATEVSITYPADGQAEVPATGWDAPTFGPGSSPGRGPATNRIAAALTYSRPYVADATSSETVPVELPAGAMTLTDESTGLAVPVLDGFPRSVPYGADSGEHLIAIQPAGDLTPCTSYRVEVTAALIDANQRPVTPYDWSFTTEGCPDPPAETTSTSGPAVLPILEPTTPTAPIGSAEPADPVAAIPTYTG